MSIGAAEWAGEAAATLLQRADDALYRAKRAGRNRCRASAPVPAASPVRRPRGRAEVPDHSVATRSAD